MCTGTEVTCNAYTRIKCVPKIAVSHACANKYCGTCAGDCDSLCRPGCSVETAPGCAGLRSCQTSATSSSTSTSTSTLAARAQERLDTVSEDGGSPRGGSGDGGHGHSHCHDFHDGHCHDADSDSDGGDGAGGSEPTNCHDGHCHDRPHVSVFTVILGALGGVCVLLIVGGMVKVKINNSSGKNAAGAGAGAVAVGASRAVENPLYGGPSATASAQDTECGRQMTNTSLVFF